MQLATELTAWMQMLALAGTDARRWEPKRLRLRLFSVAGTIARKSAGSGCTCPATHRTGHLFTTGLARLATLPQPT